MATAAAARETHAECEPRTRRTVGGYPPITPAFYGPDDRRASKAVASIMKGEGDEPAQMHKWYGKQADVRDDATVWPK